MKESIGSGKRETEREREINIITRRAFTFHGAYLHEFLRLVRDRDRDRDFQRAAFLKHGSFGVLFWSALWTENLSGFYSLFYLLETNNHACGLKR